MGAANLVRSGWTGLLLGPLAWSVNTVAGYALVPWSCGHQATLAVPALGFVLALVALGGGAISWNVDGGEHEDHRGGQLAPFGRHLGALTGLLFGIVLLSQAAAGLVINGCVR